MKYKAKLFGIYLPLFVISTLLAVILRSVACFTDYNFATDYFGSKGLISAGNYITVAACILYFAYIFTAKRDIRLIPNFTSPITYIPTGLVAVALLFISRSLGESAVSAHNKSDKITISFIVALLAAIFALFSILHFTLTAIDEKEHSTKRASFGLFTVIFMAFYSAYLYFDTSLPLNAPAKITDQMAYLFAAVFFLYETRLSLGREKWRGYIAFGFIAAMLTAYSSIPSLLLYFFKGETISNTVYESVLTFALFIFITARILLTGELIADKDSELVNILKVASEKRTAALETADDKVPEDEGYDIPDDNQISISDIENEESSADDVTLPDEKKDEATPAEEEYDLCTPNKNETYVPRKNDSETVTEENAPVSDKSSGESCISTFEQIEIPKGEEQ